MAATRRGNDVVGGLADLADRYGLTPADTAAWIAKHIGGYTPVEAERIRRNLRPVGGFRSVVESGVRSNEERFRRAGGVGARAADEVQMPVRLSAAAYNPAAVPTAIVDAAPGALRTARHYIATSTPSSVARDLGTVASKAYEEVKRDPYGYAFEGALYPAFPVAASTGDYAAMREASQSLSPYTQSDAEAANAQRMVDALSALPITAALPFVRPKRLTRRVPSNLAVRREGL